MYYTKKENNTKNGFDFTVVCVLKKSLNLINIGNRFKDETF